MEKEQVMEQETVTGEVGSELMSKWMTFWLDGQLYGASVMYADGILGMMPVTTVPEYPPYAKGVINLRGMIIPLVDLRLRFGKPEAAYTDKTCIINCMVGEQRVGFIVDEVDAVMDIPPEWISNPPRMVADPEKRYLTGIARVRIDGASEKIVLCLDVTKILAKNELQDLAQA